MPGLQKAPQSTQVRTEIAPTYAVGEEGAISGALPVVTVQRAVMTTEFENTVAVPSVAVSV